MPAAALKAREFLFLCEERALASLPAPISGLNRKLMWTMLQYQYPNPAIHFELQPQPSRGIIELGLHFEGPVETNDAVAAVIAGASADLIPALGDGWELEVWTASWRRLHRPYRFEKLTRDLAECVSGDFARALTHLDPLVRDLPEVTSAPAPARKAAAVSRRRRR